MRFLYEAISEHGRKKRGEIEADNLEQAKEIVRKNGLYLISINEKCEQQRKNAFVLFSSNKKRLPIILARQLSSLLKGGVPLYQSLVMIENQTRDLKEKKILNSLSEKVREGISLSDALKEHEGLFDDFFVYSVKAGERSGALASVLNYQANLMEKELQLISRIKAALAYPTIIVCVGIFVLLFLLGMVVPMMIKIFERLNQTLPGPTRLLLSISGFLKSESIYVIAGILVVIILFFNYRKKPSWQKVKFSILSNMPLVGELYEMTVITRFTRILSTLLRSGVPMLQALLVVSRAVKNPIYGEGIQKMADMVETGNDLSLAIKQTQLFPGFIAEMVQIGEKSGNLEEMLDHISDNYEAAISTKITTLTSLIEPLVIVFIGGFVAFILVSTLLPLFEMNKLLLKR